MRKRTAALALCLALLLCAAPARAESGFADVPADAWYQKALADLTAFEIIAGYEDGTFRPDREVRRGEFLKMVITAAEEGHTIDRGRTEIHWAYPYYQTALDNNVLVADVFAKSESGDGGGEDAANSSEPMFPGTAEALDEVISRYEMAVILSNVCMNMQMEKTVIVTNAAAYIADYAAIEPRFTTAVEQAYGKGLLLGYEDGSFGGENVLSRAESAVVIHRLLWAGERETPDWAEEQPLEVTPVTAGRGFTDVRTGETYKSFAWWLRDGHVDAYGHLDNEAKAYLFGPGTAAYTRGYFLTAAEAEPYMMNVTVPIWVLDKTGNRYSSTATLTVNKVVAEEVLLIFQEIYNDDERFPIYSGWAVGGGRFTGETGRHAWGCAIDINPYYNCECNFRSGYFRATCGYGWMPAGVTEWRGRAVGAYAGSMAAANSVYSITPNGSVVRAFADYGWGWLGNGFSNATSFDFMHFSILPSGG